ncbi:MAG: ABC transporter permease subunit, partial [Chloroflexota bacterium]|nr:ABC transporter permease subunit [Chloroflexota bacterium]
MTTITPPQNEAEVQPPSSEVGVVGWLHHNLFYSKLGGAISIVLGIILVLALWSSARWVLTQANWGVITENMRLFLVGQYPKDEIWRLWVTLALLSVTTGLSAGSSKSSAVRTLAMMVMAGQVLLALLVLISGLGIVSGLALLLSADFVWVAMYAARRWPVNRLWISLGWLATTIATVVLIAGLGGTSLLPSVTSTIWGGLLLTMLLSVVGILLSFPFGVMLAVGRRSNLPVVRLVSTTYIELIRAVPLITILFMAQFLFPLILPDGI